MSDQVVSKLPTRSTMMSTSASLTYIEDVVTESVMESAMEEAMMDFF